MLERTNNFTLRRNKLKINPGLRRGSICEEKIRERERGLQKKRESNTAGGS